MPRVWVGRAERYFTVNRVEEVKKLDSAAVCFEGRAVQCIDNEERTETFHDWRNLKLRLLYRFQELLEGDDSNKQMINLTQIGTVEV